MARAFFESIGAHCRIVKQQGPGGGEYVVLTVGYYLLISSMARHELMVYARRRKRKQNGNASSFRRWVVEASPLREWLPTDARVANGMCFIDAAASRDYFDDVAAGMPAADPADISDANPSQMEVGATNLDGPAGPTSAIHAAADGDGGAVDGSGGGAPGLGAGEGDDFGAAYLPTDDTVSTAAKEGVQSVKSVWSSGCVVLLWQRSWAVSSHLMYPRRPQDRSSGSPLSEHTHVPQFSVRAGRGAPPRTRHAPPHTSPPPRAHPSRECPLRDQQIKYTQVRNIQQVHR